MTKYDLSILYASSQPGNVVCGRSMEKAFLAGYTAAESKAKVLLDALEEYAKGFVGTAGSHQESIERYLEETRAKTAREALAAYRGEK